MVRHTGEKDHQTITCRKCGKNFIHAVHDQIKYEQRGWRPPKNCYSCRTKRKEFKDSLVRLRDACSYLNDLDTVEGVQELASAAEETVRLAKETGWFHGVEDLPEVQFTNKEIEAFLREEKSGEDQS